MKSSALLETRRVRILLMLLLSGAILLLSFLTEKSIHDVKESGGSPIRIIGKQNFPLREISGMYMFPESTGKVRQVYLIGDAHGILGIANWDGQSLTDYRLIDFSQSMTEAWGLCSGTQVTGCQEHLRFITSQWEAVTSDASRKAFLLHEQLGTIFVIDPESQEISSLISLESFSIGQDKKTRLSQHHQKKLKNAMGEGLLLLKNGHILVAKERGDPALIEFGPEGSDSVGYHKELWVADTAVFPIPERKNRLFPLKIWRLPERLKSCDMSELGVDKEGSLLVLSQSCGWISRLNSLLPEDSFLSFKEMWSLPGELRKAEAFVIPEAGMFLVAEDQESSSVMNVFVLSSGMEATMPVATALHKQGLLSEN
ncbi:MAG: hypothetical protein H6618_03510 [Deltaproteobacteria bacterium]|nr:hypothetical protein [Deltaproteobacteria bacterium]